MSKWRKIETAPKDGTAVLVIDMSADEPFADLVHWSDYPDEAGPQWYVGRGLADDIEQSPMIWYSTPTHWMPIPEPPA